MALDTEFVDLEKAEIEVKADGTQEMIRPSKSGLARVSVIRGSGTREGVPFIDDYITIKDTIVDYVTQFSGIQPGDLDPRSSRHNLVPLKVAYKKLWLLLNLGCVFVGHGLASDFRKINIQVPKNQTVDTQYLFFHPSTNRRLSLRYLAWAVFKEYIQEEPVAGATVSTTTTQNIPEGTAATATVTSTAFAGHDSIEDARMALRLWKKFQEFSDAGIVNRILEEIFRDGAKHGFRPPPRHQPSPTPATVAPSGGPSSSSSSLLSAPNNTNSNSNNTAGPNTISRLGPTSTPSGRNTPDFSSTTTSSIAPDSVNENNSTPSTPRQGVRRRSAALTPSNETFGAGAGNARTPMFGGSPLR